MNPLRIITVILCAAFCSHAFAEVQDIDKELTALADKLATQVKDQAKKKIAVVDFSDLQGTTQGELGKYIAEELTVDLVMAKHDFSVLDRANLSRILAEHKLTSQGLVDPENAKKIGQFAGVDALIFGTIIPKGTNSISLTVKIITTDTAEIVGAAKSEFKADDTVQQLVSKPVAASSGGSASKLLQDEKAQVVKSFGDLTVELDSLDIVNQKYFRLNTVLKNQNAKSSIWVAFSIENNGDPRATLTDPDRFEFHSGEPSGIAEDSVNYAGTFYHATEIKPGDSIPVSIPFGSPSGKIASPGLCSVRMEFLLATTMNGNLGGAATPQTLAAKIEAK